MPSYGFQATEGGVGDTFMRQVAPWLIWIGNRGDVGQPVQITRAGLQAVVDLALDSLPVAMPRDVVLCRFPLVDGPGNGPGVARAAVETVAGLMRSRVPTLVVCSAGMSRSPSVVAGAMALVTGRPMGDCLGEVTFGSPADVSPALWGQVQGAVAAARSREPIQ